jgi:hypothetical protein
VEMLKNFMVKQLVQYFLNSLIFLINQVYGNTSLFKRKLSRTSNYGLRVVLDHRESCIPVAVPSNDL